MGRGRVGIVAVGKGLALAGVSIGVLAATQASAQETLPDPDEEVVSSVETTKGEVIVTGIRGSVASAIEKKRNSREIVDSVVAEDVGKLPDNNVPEALARVTGVQIDRVHGEGSSVTIRGLSDVQTTINGNEASAAGSRSLNLADIPAELLKSVDVYKTRSASQTEGGIAGTVNVELRRPLDMEKGLTVAGSFRETFSDIGDTKSPYGSLLIAERFDTGIGEMGFLLNGSLTQNNYQENWVAAESPQQIGFFSGSASNALLPPELQDTIIPFAVTYGEESGSLKRPSLNVSWQWQANDRLDFVLEGSYLGVRATEVSDYLKMQTNTDQGFYSDLIVNDDGTIRSVTLNNPNGVPGGPLDIYQKRKSDTYNANFETNWRGDRTRIKFGTQYNWSDTSDYFVQHQSRFVGGRATHVDFNSDNVPGGGPYVTFPGVDADDPESYKLYQVHDQNGANSDTLFASNLDVTVDTSERGLLRSFQFGARYTKRTMRNLYGYRDAFFFTNATAPTLGSVGAATGIELATTRPEIRNAGEIPTWYHFDNASFYRNFDSIREYILANGADLQGRDWTTATPGNNDPGQTYSQKEQTFAAYGELNYGLNAPFPIDGTLGLRFVNTWGTSSSTQYSYGRNPDGSSDGVLRMEEVGSRGNYTDMLPSATAIVHFTPKLQLRLSYTHNVQRPGFYAMRNFKELRDAIASPTGRVYAGNPDLKPVQENNYDASLEYFFGEGGLLSLGAFLKNQTGFIYYTNQTEYVAEIGRDALVFKERNAGPGKIFGIESQATGFFDFLPGFARHFGASVNFTYIPVSELHLYEDENTPDVPGVFDAPFTSEYSGNAALFYDTPVFSARVAYNYRSKYKASVNYEFPGYSVYMQETSRLDGAVNYTPFKFITFSLEGTNLLRDRANTYFGAFQALPVGLREQARTIQASARFRF
ncbi:TonB-dependent receptor [Sphingomonas sp. ac-8]|uniref:TonB-dependent receptor n=1 Tax=Sphingomonas sp. ac-8 TaxID=3242977 RepID=UPI003A7FDB1D